MNFSFDSWYDWISSSSNRIFKFVSKLDRWQEISFCLMDLFSRNEIEIGKGKSMHNIHNLIFDLSTHQLSNLLNWLMLFFLFIVFSLCGPWYAAYVFPFFTVTGYWPVSIFYLHWEAKPSKKPYCINVLIKQKRTHPFMLYCISPETDRWDSICIQQSISFSKADGQ